MSSEPYLMEARQIVKNYGHVEVLRGTDFHASPGKVTALIGDNGAGKSTLVKILSGVMPAQGGTILLNGKPVEFASPIHARDLGIETVYQDLALARTSGRRRTRTSAASSSSRASSAGSACSTRSACGGRRSVPSPPSAPT